jgi:hypothetical protein
VYKCIVTIANVWVIGQVDVTRIPPIGRKDVSSVGRSGTCKSKKKDKDEDKDKERIRIKGRARAKTNQI